MALVQGCEMSIKCVQADLPAFVYGQLLSPLSHQPSWSGKFAIDNGAFKGFDRLKFEQMIATEKPNIDRCLFVAAPDVVASARRTMEVFRYWFPKLNGWPVALVAQDGIEDLDIPWSLLKAIFIGGSTAWKLSAEAEAVIRAAQAMDKWVHVGRVNTSHRIEKFLDLGVDSIDGASLSRHGAGYTRDRKRIRVKLSEPQLPLVT